jgi:excisionase family DNA binding protein
MAEDRLLTPKEVAERLNRHEKTIIRWCREGYLPCKRFGKLWGMMASDLERWMADPPLYLRRGQELGILVPDCPDKYPIPSRLILVIQKPISGPTQQRVTW